MYTVYVAPMGAGSDMSHVANGLVQALQAAGLKVARFKPLGEGVSLESANQLWAKGSNDQLMEDVISAFYAADDDAQVVVVEGVVNDFTAAGALAPYAAQLNTQLIRNLQADVVLVIGTSLKVYPAAGLLHYAPAHARIWLIDPHPAATLPGVQVIAERASIGVAQVVQQLLQGLLGRVGRGRQASHAVSSAALVFCSTRWSHTLRNLPLTRLRTNSASSCT